MFIISIFPLKTGDFVECVDDGESTDEFVVTYPYGEDGKEMFSGLGLGKSDSVPVLSSSIIKKTERFFTVIEQFHKKDTLFWITKEGRVFVSYPYFNSLGDVAYATGDNVYSMQEVVRGLHGRLTYGTHTSCAFTYQFFGFILVERNLIIKAPIEDEELGDFYPSIRKHVEENLLPFLKGLDFKNHKQVLYTIKDLNIAEERYFLEDSYFVHDNYRILE